MVIMVMVMMMGAGSDPGNRIADVIMLRGLRYVAMRNPSSE